MQVPVKPRILFILHFPPPIHGAAMMGKYIRESKVINAEFEADFINLSTSSNLTEGGKFGFSKIFKLQQIQGSVLRKLFRKKYDLCYVTLTSHGPGFYKDFLIVLLLKLFRQKIIYHFHNKGVSIRQSIKLDNFLYKYSFKKTQTILLSEHLYQDIEKYVDRKNVFYCYNGIPVNDSILNSQHALDADKPCSILFLSNMMEAKGAFVLLEACRLLKEKGIFFECHYVGDWSDITENIFNERIKDGDLKKYVFAHGKKYDEEKFSYFRAADIFVFPTLNECFGLVLLEAMEFGLPIISTSEGAIPDIIVDEKTGFLVPKKNSQALAGKIEFLIKQPELRMQMGSAGRERFKELFTLDKFEKNLTGILKKAIGKNI